MVNCYSIHLASRFIVSFMSESSAEAIVVLIAAGSREEAVRLADLIVVARLAACVQVLPEIESVYHWEGKVERSAEILLFAKTTRSNFQALEAAVRALHSYQIPEIVAFDITAASAPYLEWLTSSVITQDKDAAHGSVPRA
ncbi:MAG: periplasmic divalent cation tolerance protein [Acidobacteriota bacterium]|nr:periplasmic divalent cation tolerance protein [Acidobacteriota bacterium]